jgi:hypothetical protein
LRRCTWIMAIGIVGLTGSSMAHAGALTAKTMRKELPAREVERSLNMPRGWVEFGLVYDHKIGVGYWGADGSRNTFENTEWTHQTETFTVRYGISPRAELWWAAETHQARLVNDVLGTDTRDSAMGDQWVGYRLSLFEQAAPTVSAVFETHLKMAAGKEQAGTYIGGPLNVSGFVFSTGTPDLYVGAAAKKVFGPIGVTGRLGYMHRFSGVVNYLIEIESYQFQGRMKPGSEVQASVEVLAQLGPITVSATPRVEYRMQSRQGTSAPGIFPAKNLRPVVGSDGLAIDLEGRLRFQVNRNLDIELYTSQPLAGQDLQFFPLEDIHPTLGPTYGGAVEVRY